MELLFPSGYYVIQFPNGQFLSRKGDKLLLATDDLLESKRFFGKMTAQNYAKKIEHWNATVHRLVSVNLEEVE